MIQRVSEEGFEEDMHQFDELKEEKRLRENFLVH